MLRSVGRVRAPLLRCCATLQLVNRPLLIRRLHGSRVLLDKFLPHSENAQSYEFLAKDPKYQATLAPLSNDFYRPENTLTNDQFMELIFANKWTKDNVLDDFVRVSYYIYDQQMTTTIAEPCFSNMVSMLILCAPEFDHDTICKVLFCLRLWPRVIAARKTNFNDLWNALDKVCMDNFKKWTKPQMLIVCDHFYHLNLSRIFRSGKFMLEKILQRGAASTSEVVQSLFYVNLRRYFPDLDKVRLQVNLEKTISALNTEEVGICAMAFFKTETRIVSIQLMEMMIRKFIANASTAHHISIACLMKAIRMGLHIRLIPLTTQLFDELYLRIKNEDFPFTTCVQLVVAGTNVQKPHYKLIHSASEQLLKNISDIRLKDMERMCLALQMYNIPKQFPGITDDAFELIGTELSRPERQQEIDKFPGSFTCLLHFLSVGGYFNYKLMDLAFSNKFYENVYYPSVKRSGFEIVSLDVSIEVECPDYSGSRLSLKGRRHLSKELGQNPAYYADIYQDLNRGSFCDKQLKQIGVAMSKIIGPEWKEKMTINHVLPNFHRPDLVFKLDQSCENFEKIPESFTSAWIGSIKKPDSVNWVCVVLASRGLIIRDSDPLECVGNLHYKLRLLEKVGYNTILVKSLVWPEDEKEQLSFMQLLLKDCQSKLKGQSKKVVVN